MDIELNKETVGILKALLITEPRPPVVWDADSIYVSIVILPAYLSRG